MNIREIRSQIVTAADKLCEMLELIEKGFMENKPEILAEAIKRENEINETEKILIRNILELSKTSDKKKELVALEQMIETLERMGDEGASIIERIEVKICEKLLFSDLDVVQFNETYCATQDSVTLMRDFLKKNSSALKEKVINNGFRVKELVERYRKEHAERLVKGLGTPMGANMYFDMLDFTGNLARHSSNMVKLV
jgi:Na+/phosphate symporter